MSFTPGPWRVGDAGATVFGPPTGNPSPETIANVRRADNARLIAAAPELLAALRGILEIGKRDMSNPKYDGYFATASDAIAKAEGR